MFSSTWCLTPFNIKPWKTWLTLGAWSISSLLKNFSLHMLIWVCTFINISEYSSLHIYSNLHNYWNWREILSSCKLIKICCKRFIQFWIFLLLMSKIHLTLFVRTEIYRVCEKFSCLHIYSCCTIIRFEKLSSLHIYSILHNYWILKFIQPAHLFHPAQLWERVEYM